MQCTAHLCHAHVHELLAVKIEPFYSQSALRVQQNATDLFNCHLDFLSLVLFLEGMFWSCCLPGTNRKMLTPVIALEWCQGLTVGKPEAVTNTVQP